jgi:hypothetical protein
MKKKIKKITLGTIIIAGFLTIAEVIITTPYDDCIYEINYPDGNGNTIRKQSKDYAESYFINGVSQHKYYFIPLNETDTIFFIGDGQTWNMKRLSCE